ncbi:MAG TPA: glyceraldehyde-3-phosphate dehydrogenase [Bacteroidetes bacterium]|nr:MAG: glyceraldehyde-3-phosphate dehydrogenase [Bacteroidota bacterium]HHE65257.1 glyceraldehyde-3-phosphate dehydrogenase [Bacteroidota bacterium]
MSKLNYDNELDGWLKRERAAYDLIGSVGNLICNKSVELVLFRNALVDLGATEILRLHKHAKDMIGKPINVMHSANLAKRILELDLPPAKIDIGLLSFEYDEEKDNYESIDDFITDKLSNLIGNKTNWFEPKDVVLFGFGRIGRLAARELIRQAGKGQQLRLRAIVTRGNSDAEIAKRAALLRMDSVHGNFPGIVHEDYENKSLIINGQVVHMISGSVPEDIDYAQFGIKDAMIIDNTGAFRDKEELGRHLKAKGISQVLLTAPGKGVPNIVYGINEGDVDRDNDKIISAASCTTNAISPILKVMEDRFGIVRGHIETVHSYTNDQNLLDNMHKKHRRGRSAPINMVITETGAGNAVTKVIPSLMDKLTANAVRVPLPNGSLAIIQLNLSKEVTVDEVNGQIKDEALNGRLINQIHYSIENDLVSSDIIGDNSPAVFDSPATIVNKDGKNVVLYTWYDNEFGYTKQVIRLAKYFAKVRRKKYY